MKPGPYPSLAVRFTVEHSTQVVSALVDTGFDGHLAVPASLISGFPSPAYRQRVETATGQVVAVPVFPGTLEFTGSPGSLDVLIIALGDEFLVGLLSINHFRVTFDHGQRLIIEP